MMGDRDFLAVRHGAAAKIGAIGKAVAYLVFALAGALLVTAIAKAVFGASLVELAQRGAVSGAVRAVLLLLGVVVLPTALALLIFREPLNQSGWSFAQAPKLAGWGAATGFGLLAAIAVAMWALGAVQFRVVAPSMAGAIESLLLCALLWLAQAAGEEGLHRGFAFVQICRAISFWPAAILSSAWFLYGHVGNDGETPLGIAATGMLGLALSYSLLRTGSLWFALGFHAAWNFAQSFILGFNNSGGKPPASLLSADVVGSPLVTGGSAGPEASILIVPAAIALFAIIWRLGQDRGAAPAS